MNYEVVNLSLASVFLDVCQGNTLVYVYVVVVCVYVFHVIAKKKKMRIRNQSVHIL